MSKHGDKIAPGTAARPPIVGRARETQFIDGALDALTYDSIGFGAPGTRCSAESLDAFGAYSAPARHVQFFDPRGLVF
jgi:hypothetical protein